MAFALSAPPAVAAVGKRLGEHMGVASRNGDVMLALGVIAILMVLIVPLPSRLLAWRRCQSRICTGTPEQGGQRTRRRGWTRTSERSRSHADHRV